MSRIEEIVQELRDEGVDDFTINAMLHSMLDPSPRMQFCNEFLKKCISVQPVEKPEGHVFAMKFTSVELPKTSEEA
jgi:hypothetical protein